MNILAIGAHFDDVELGCGGSLAKYAKQGHDVYVYVATDSGFTNYNKETIRSNETALAEARAAMKLIGVKEMICGKFNTLAVEFVDDLNVEILRIVEEKEIDLVFTHWTGDIHHDHLAVARASLHSCRHVPKLLMYRSNWYHSTLDFRGNFYIDITNCWELKKKAIQAHESEMARTGAKWISFFHNEAENAGQRIGVRYAEVYEVVKWLQL
ncbi:PIG-L deacetylase family protein [Dechloromonas denitrificans]|uniref:PIG-L deacetylase family protein n=1 Tax=Dechloromonas denitrificans TaxID=281362 RepID=UPI001CF89565|nr:PIG-L deacetylase family protein [Dechloromonas denitrificans]UCV02380.1 PIG-L family deacetylase [Dechloromonas denitrificans]